MGITLEKKQTISLAKQSGSTLTKVSMGLGWDAAKTGGGLLGAFFGGGGGNSIDLDASCILMDANKRPLDVVWFGQLDSKDGSICHSGDNRTGDGDGDDETINVDLQALPANVKYLVFTVNSFNGQNFSKVANAYCRVVDNATGKELARYNLSEQGNHTGMIMAYLTRNGNDWNMTAVGEKANGRTVRELADLAVNLVAG
jgi:tellurium resistance protein TerZ